MSLREDGKRIHYGRLAIWFSIPIILHFLNNVISSYVVSIGWSIVLLVIIQITAIPVYIYLLDAGLRDQLRTLPSDSIIENNIIVVNTQT
jgi:RsiW-degrading membrane proteinase PrsW (M82 family)